MRFGLAKRTELSSCLPDLASKRLRSPSGPLRWSRRVGPVALPDRPSQTDALGRSWLFLQRNNSQTHNCHYKYEDLCGP
jgi:hypothetical protein